MGYVIASMIFILGTVISGAIYEFNFNAENTGVNLQVNLLIAVGFLFFFDFNCFFDESEILFRH